MALGDLDLDLPLMEVEGDDNLVWRGRPLYGEGPDPRRLLGRVAGMVGLSSNEVPLPLRCSISMMYLFIFVVLSPGIYAAFLQARGLRPVLYGVCPWLEQWFGQRVPCG